MTFRSSSRLQQWVRWLCAALVGLAAHVVVSRLAFGAVIWNPFVPQGHRLYLVLGALFACYAWETRWDGVVREGNGEKGERGGKGESGEEARGEEAQWNNLSSVHLSASPSPQSSQTLKPSNSQVPYAPLPGEAEYAQARAMPHQEIPDFETDGEYLELLGKAAAAGYARAYAKLGDYAMRRCAWVEAYYWMWRAQKNGMLDLAPILREIRQNWAQDGFSDEAENINDLFAEESGSIGRALLSIASGHDAVVAKAFLKANHPEFLP